MAALVLAEHDNAELKPATLNTVAAAVACGGPVTLLVAGANCAAVADQASKVAGVDRVLLVDDSHYEHPLAEPLADLLADLAGEYSHLLAPATTFGKNVLPRVAALRDVAMISEIVAVDGADTFVRPIYAGNAIQKVTSSDETKVFSIRTTVFDAAEQTGSAEVENIDAAEDPGLSEWVEDRVVESERPELTSAKIVVSGGRGVGSKENFEIVAKLADKLGAAVGASRAAVDSGYAPNDWQVGQTGKVVAPDLYVAIGISGAIQHLAGMKDSKVIVAINKDDEAPIFQVADYGLVADLFQALPELEQELDKG